MVIIIKIKYSSIIIKYSIRQVYFDYFIKKLSHYLVVVTINFMLLNPVITYTFFKLKVLLPTLKIFIVPSIFNIINQIINFNFN